MVLSPGTPALQHHEKSQEGSKGGNGFFHLRWVLPVVGSKTMVDHTSLRWVQADGEGESGATSKIPSKWGTHNICVKTIANVLHA